MEKGRLEAFSDGVLAIVITIMILELRLPSGDGVGDLLSLLPPLLTYLVSFLFIAIYWVNHHLVFHSVEQVDLPILWCNITWLFFLSFIPFATAWVGNHPTSWVPLSLYFSDMTLACIAFHLMCFYVQRIHGKRLRLGARSITSLAVYFGAAALGGFCPVAAFIAVAAVSCSWIVPKKDG